jgi:hypothetical protein
MEVHDRRYYYLVYPATIDPVRWTMKVPRRGRTSTYMGIILWPKRTRTDGEIKDVLSSPRRWTVVSNTRPVVALVCILWLFQKELPSAMNE